VKRSWAAIRASGGCLPKSSARAGRSIGWGIFRADCAAIGKVNKQRGDSGGESPRLGVTVVCYLPTLVGGEPIASLSAGSASRALTSIATALNVTLPSAPSSVVNV
jgi:hypothetical protein